MLHIWLYVIFCPLLSDFVFHFSALLMQKVIV